MTSSAAPLSIPPEKATPIGSSRAGYAVNRREPLRDFVGECADVAAANLVEIRRQHAARRVEEAGVGRIRIGTADQPQLEDEVRGHHPRVTGVELRGKAFAVECAMQRVDPIGDEQRGSFLALGEEVSHRSIERTRQPHGDAVSCHQRERAIDRAHIGRAAAANTRRRASSTGML